jgi:hyaluronan synthase
MRIASIQNPGLLGTGTARPGHADGSASLSDRVAKSAILVLAFILSVYVIERAISLTGSPAEGHAWSDTVWLATVAYGFLMYGAFIWRVVLWRRYRPMPAVEESALPGVSVIIPAFNEGPLVRQSILSAASSRYPADRLEIIVIDDGSDDDTWDHICAAARLVGDRVRIVAMRQSRNLGKRHALHRGFGAARGDVFVTTDSDSILEPDALANAVSPLVRDGRIGCVAGCVRVLNPHDSIFTRFLKCTFSLSFRFVRAYQNEFRGVFCTPGALSVYRADVVRRVASEWVSQRFLGRACTTGEDRAMTNLFLREGWLTAYQGNAVVHAKMPHTYRGMTNMFLRWARSNLRETAFLFGFLFSNFRTSHLNAFRLNMILASLSLMMPPLLIFNGLSLSLLVDGFSHRHAALMLFWSATMAWIYWRNERDSDWVWLFAYQFFWVPCVSWIIPYAALTLRDNGWLTRGTRATPVSAEMQPIMRAAPALAGR